MGKSANWLIELLRDANPEAYIELHYDGSGRWVIDGSFSVKRLEAVVEAIRAEHP